MRYLPNRRRLLALAVVGAGINTCAGEAFAVDRTWLNANGGTFTTPSNWSGGVVPSSADQAIFDLSGSPYTVQFASNVLTSGLSVRNNLVTFDLNGFTYSLNNFISVFSSINSPTLRVDDGTLTTSTTVQVNGNGKLSLGSGGHLRSTSGSIGVISAGTLNFVSTAADWVNTGTISVGNLGGSGTLVVDFRNVVTTGTLVVGGSNATGYVQFDDNSRLDAGSVGIAVGGAGSMELLNGSDALLTGRLTIGAFSGGTIPTETTRGSVLVDGVGSSIAAAELAVGGSQGAGTLTIHGGGTISTTGLGSIGFFGGAGTVVLDGTGSRWNAGSITVGNGGSGVLDIRPGTSVVATGALNVATFGTVNVNAATLSVGSFGLVNGQLNFNSGTLAVTGTAGFSIGGATTPLGPTIQLNGTQDLRVTTTLTLQSGGQLALNGGRVTAGTFTNNGELLFLSTTSRVTGHVNNFGLIRGSGAILGGGFIRNKAGGQISVAGAERLRVAGVMVNESEGMIDIAHGGEFDGGNLTNSGRIFIDDGMLRASSIDTTTTSLIQGRGTVITAGPFVNNGTVSLSGGFSDVVSASNYNNQATGKTIVTGGAVASFFLPVNNLAGSEFRVSTNSTAVFFNAVSGLSAFTGTGTVVFEGPASLGVIDRGGTTVVESSGALAVGHVRDNALFVRGPVTIVPNGTTTGTSRVTRLEVDGGRLDLNDNDLVIDYTGPSPIQTVRQQIRSGFNNGSWNGSGIITSLGNASSLGLGYAEASAIFTSFPATFSGQEVDNTSVLIAFTRYGDANLDGVVNLQDFNRLAANFGGTNKFWSQGDFNYDGLVNLQDFNRLAANFGLAATGVAPTPQDWANLAAAVPEPASASIFMALASTLACRRRRRRVQREDALRDSSFMVSWPPVSSARGPTALQVPRATAPPT